MKKFGFTLAEVLITLSVIGIIAAITLPSVWANVQDQAFAKQTQKIYRNLSESVALFMANEEIEDLTQATLVPDTFIQEYFRVTNTNCGAAATSSCYGDSYRYGDSAALSKDTIFANITNAYQTDDGYVISIPTTATYPMKVVVDVNGSKNPNTLGRDLWVMYVTNEGRVTGSTTDALGDAFAQFITNGNRVVATARSIDPLHDQIEEDQNLKNIQTGESGDKVADD